VGPCRHLGQPDRSELPYRFSASAANAVQLIATRPKGGDDLLVVGAPASWRARCAGTWLLHLLDAQYLRTVLRDRFIALGISGSASLGPCHLPGFGVVQRQFISTGWGNLNAHTGENSTTLATCRSSCAASCWACARTKSWPARRSASSRSWAWVSRWLVG